MKNDENGYYMPVYMCELCGAVLVDTNKRITGKDSAISITDHIGCLGRGVLSSLGIKHPHVCQDGSIGIADLIGMKYFEEQKS